MSAAPAPRKRGRRPAAVAKASSSPVQRGRGTAESGGGGSPASAPVTDAKSFQAATGATPAQMADLASYLDMLADWNQRMNLVGPSALADFWGRHAYDSAQLLRVEPEALTWADLGAGAGLPGIVLAILLKGRPGARVHLVESMAKRCTFLSAVVAALDLPAQVHRDRAEDLSLMVDIVTARACAPMSRLLEFAWPCFRKGARGLFLKGQDVEAELAEATRYWKFNAKLLPSRSSASGRLVRVKGLRHAS